MKTKAVYKITNSTNGLIYIGGSIDVKARWSDHRSQLKSGRCPAVRMLADYRITGLAPFHFEIIQRLAPGEDLRASEQAWLDKLRPFDPAIGYNTHPRAESPATMVRSPETRERMRASRATWEMTPETGAKISAGRKASVRAKSATLTLNATKRTLTDDEARSVVRMYREGMTQEDIGDHFGLTRRPIRAILAGETYGHATGIKRRAA